MLKRKCPSCGRCEDKPADMSVRKTLISVWFVFGLPFLSFLTGVFFGVILLQGEGRYLYSVLIGFIFMMFSYVIAARITKRR